ncbi:hypothetical protein BN1723_010599 [Verticillium longisporum]|uniref:Uncharacterized protein n=1 Tax=Verticillium longisporum TaxID=100787 RepID=A0A0G4L0N7_VERLO|nr:hypothetical protein BN1723_010599 [Verticillium longisporum]
MCPKPHPLTLPPLETACFPQFARLARLAGPRDQRPLACRTADRSHPKAKWRPRTAPPQVPLAHVAGDATVAHHPRKPVLRIRHGDTIRLAAWRLVGKLRTGRAPEPRPASRDAGAESPTSGLLCDPIEEDRHGNHTNIPHRPDTALS